MISQRLTFAWTTEQIALLAERARKSGCQGDTDRELIYQYFCMREGLDPVRHGGVRPGGFEPGNQHGLNFKKTSNRKKKRPS